MSTVTPITPGIGATPGLPPREPKRPGSVESFMVVVTVFVMAYSLPNYWFVSADGSLSAEAEGGALLLFSLVVLVGIAFARVIGELDLIAELLKSDGLLLAFVGWATLSTLWSDYPNGTLYYSMLLILGVLYAMYLVMRFTLGQILGLAGYAIAFGTVVNFAFIVAGGTYGRSVVAGEQLWDGVYGNKNNLGFFAAIALPILFVLARSPGRITVFWFVVAGANAVLLYGSGSKTMGGAGIASVLLLVAYHAFRARHTLRGGVIMTLTAAIVAMFAYITSNLGSLVEKVGKDPSLTGRTDLWADLIPVIKERLLAGWGYAATFRGYGSPVHEVWVKNDWEPDHAHNAFLAMAADLGLIGLALMTALLARGLWRGIKVTEFTTGATALYPLVMVSFVVLVSITEIGVNTASFGWLMLCICLLILGRSSIIQPDQ